MHGHETQGRCRKQSVSCRKWNKAKAPSETLVAFLPDIDIQISKTRARLQRPATCNTYLLHERNIVSYTFIMMLHDSYVATVIFAITMTMCTAIYDCDYDWYNCYYCCHYHYAHCDQHVMPLCFFCNNYEIVTYYCY